MAAKKSAWEEASDWIKNTTSNVSNRVSNTFKPIVDKAQNIQTNFSQGYNNYIKAREAADQAQQSRINFTTRKILETPTQSRISLRVNPIVEPFKIPSQTNPTVAPLEIPEQATSASLKKTQKIPEEVSSFISKIRDFAPLDVGIESFKSGLYSGAGSLLDTINKSRIYQPEPKGKEFERILADSQDESLPKWKRDFAMSQLVQYKGYEDYGKGAELRDSLLKKGEEKYVESQKMQENLTPIEATTLQESMRDPKWWSRNITIQVPQIVGMAIPTIIAAYFSKGASLFTGLTAGYTLSSGEMYNNARAEGISKEDSLALARNYGYLSSVLEYAGIGEILDKMPGGNAVKKRIIGSMMKEIAITTAEEGTTEAMQQVLQNAMLSTKVDDIPLTQGVVESLIFGGIGGAIQGGGTFAVLNSLPDQSSGQVLGIDATSKKNAFQSGINTDEELNTYLNTPDKIKWDTAITVTEKDGKPVLKRESFNLETGESNSETKPITHLYQALSNEQFQEYINNGFIPSDRAVFSYKDPSLLLPDEGGYVIKVSAENLKTKLDESGEFVLANENVPLDKIITVNNQQFVPEGNAVTAISEDIKKTFSDSEKNITNAEGAQTGPVDTRITGEEAQAAIRGMFTEEEINFVTGGSKDVVDSNGNPVHGKYYDSVISVVEEQGKVSEKTVYHEAFHAYADKFADPDLYQAALDETKAKNEKMTDKAAAEALADQFADYMGQRRSFSGQILAFFQDMIAKIQSLVGKENQARELFSQARQGARNEGVPTNEEQYRVKTDKQSNNPTAKEVKAEEDALKAQIENEMPNREDRNDLVRIGGKYYRRQEVETINSIRELEGKAPLGERPANLKKRGFIKGVERDPAISEEIRSKIAENENAWYAEITNKQAISNAKANIKRNKDRVLARVLSDEIPTTGKEMARLNAESMVLAREAILNRQNDLADQIIIKLAEKGTYFGQGLQSFSMWQRMTPEGMLKFARRQIDKANQEMGFVDKAFRGGKEFKLSDTTRDQILGRMQEIEQMTDGKAKEEALTDVMELIAKDMPLTASELFTAFRYQNLLSNPLTHIRNLAGNLQQLLIVKPLEDTVAAGFDVVVSGITGKERQNYFDLPIQTRAALNSVPLANQSFWDALAGKTAINKPDVSSINAIRQSQVPASISIVTRVLEGGDRFFQTILQEAETAARTQRGTELKQAQIEAKEVAESFLFRRKVNSRDENQGAFLQKFDEITEAVQKARKIPFVSWMIPFVQTTMNIAKMQYEYSPFGYTTLIGNTNKTRQFAKATIGTAVTTLGFTLAAAGRTTWEAPSDEEEKSLYYDSGRRPYSVLIETPLGEKWVPMQSFGVWGLALAIPAAIAYEMKDSKTALSNSQLENLKRGVFNIAKFYTSMTYLENLDQMVKLLSGDTDYTTGTTLAFTASQIIPANGLVSYIARVIDPTYRKANNFQEGIMRALPGLSKQLEPHRTTTGAPATRPLSAYTGPYTLGTPNETYETLYQNRKSENQLRSKVNAIKKKVEDAESNIFNFSGISSEEKGLENLKKNASTMVESYFATEDPQIRSEIESSFALMGISLEDALDMDIASEIKPPPKGLGEEATQKIQRSNEFSYIKSVVDKYGQFPQAQSFIENKMKEFNISVEDVIYDNKTALPDDVQLDQIHEEISGLQGQDLLQALVKMRVVSDGTRKALLTDTLINKLQDEGIISETSADFLKEVVWDSKTQSFVKKKSSGSSKKKASPYAGIKTSVPKINSIPISKIGPTEADFKPIPIKSLDMGKITTQLPQYNPLEVSNGSFSPNKVSLTIPKPVTNISGLGRVR